MQAAFFACHEQIIMYFGQSINQSVSQSINNNLFCASLTRHARKRLTTIGL